MKHVDEAKSQASRQEMDKFTNQDYRSMGYLSGPRDLFDGIVMMIMRMAAVSEGRVACTEG